MQTSVIVNDSNFYTHVRFKESKCRFWLRCVKSPNEIDSTKIESHSRLLAHSIAISISWLEIHTNVYSSSKWMNYALWLTWIMVKEMLRLKIFPRRNWILVRFKIYFLWQMTLGCKVSSFLVQKKWEKIVQWSYSWFCDFIWQIRYNKGNP